MATRKAIAASDLASSVITEDRFRVLLQSVQPGTPIGARPVVRVTTATAPVGRLKGCRVLVLGGPHDVSARVRDEVMAHGGRVAVNLTPTVSHLIALVAADTDIRYPRTAHLLRLQMFRDEAAAGRSEALVNLSSWLESWGREEDAEQALRDAANLGEVVALRTLPAWLAKRPGRDADIEGYLRDAVASGGSWALRQLVEWLANHNRPAEAEELLRAAVADDLAGAPTQLAQWLSSQADREDEANQAWRCATEKDPLDAALGLWASNREIADIDQVFRKAIVDGHPRGLEKFVQWLETQPNRVAEGNWIQRAGLDAFGRTLSRNEITHRSP